MRLHLSTAASRLDIAYKAFGVIKFTAQVPFDFQTLQSQACSLIDYLALWPWHRRSRASTAFETERHTRLVPSGSFFSHLMTKNKHPMTLATSNFTTTHITSKRTRYLADSTHEPLHNHQMSIFISRSRTSLRTPQIPWTRYALPHR